MFSKKFFVGASIVIATMLFGCQSGPNTMVTPAPSATPVASASPSAPTTTSSSSLITEKGQAADKASNGFFSEVVKYQGKSSDFGMETVEGQPIVMTIGNSDAIFIPKDMQNKEIVKSTRTESKAPDQYKKLAEQFAYWAISKTYGYNEAEKGIIGLFPTGKLEKLEDKLTQPEIVVDQSDLKIGEIYYSATINFFTKKMDVHIQVKTAKVFDLKVNGYPMYLSTGENKTTFKNLPLGDIEYQVSGGKIQLDKEKVEKISIKGPTLTNAIKSNGQFPKDKKDKDDAK